MLKLRTPPPVTRETKAFSWVRALASLDDGRPTSLEERSFDKVARDSFANLPAASFYAPWESLLGLRAIQTSGNFTAGGALIEESMSIVAPAIRPASFAAQAGMQAIEAGGIVLIPRWSSAVTASWVSETQAVPQVDATLAELSLSPRSVGCSAVFSAQLLEQTGGGLEEFLRAELRGAIGQAIDGAAISGSGGAEPLGVVNVPGVSQDVTFAGPASWAKIVSFEENLGLDNVEHLENTRFVVSHATRSKLKTKERGTSGSGFIMEGTPTGEFINGYRTHTTNFLAGSNRVLFGDFREVYLANWGPLAVTVDRVTDAPTRRIRLTVCATVDIGIRRPIVWQVSTDSGAQ